MQEETSTNNSCIEIPGVKIEITKDALWGTLGIIVILVLAIYTGIRFINRLFDKNSLWR